MTDFFDDSGIGQPRLYWNKRQKLLLFLAYKDMFSQFCVSYVQFVSYSLIPLALLSFNLSLGSGHHLLLTTGVMSTLHSSTKKSAQGNWPLRVQKVLLHLWSELHQILTGSQHFTARCIRKNTCNTVTVKYPIAHQTMVVKNAFMF